jgi:hypothetical protein
MSNNRPDLNYTDIPLNNEPKLYQQYTTTALIATGKPTTDIPPIPEIQRLNAELEGLKDAAILREQQIKSNLELVHMWLKKNEKLGSTGTATGSTASLSHSGVEGSESPTLSAPPSVMGSTPSLVGTPLAKVEKKSKIVLGKVKVKDELVTVKPEEGIGRVCTACVGRLLKLRC